MTVTYAKQHEYLVGVDSDGCAFDSMEIKHKECFIPNFIKHMGLQPVSKYAREACEFTNLYSKTRGANRFPSYLLALDLLEERPEVQARNVSLPKLKGVRDWVARESKLGTKTIVPEAEKTGDPDLKQAAAWSSAVDDAVAEMVHGLPPFPGVREALETMSKQADQIVRGSIVLPNGIGKSKVVLVFAQGDNAAAAEKAGADYVGGKELADKVKGGWTEFDAAIATPDMMGLVGPLGRVLGPRVWRPLHRGDDHRDILWTDQRDRQRDRQHGRQHGRHQQRRVDLREQRRVDLRRIDDAVEHGLDLGGDDLERLRLDRRHVDLRGHDRRSGRLPADGF